MKSLLQFMKEAESQAAVQAKKLNLASDGHGSWMDTRGNIVATTEKGKLVFLKGRKKKGEEEGPGGCDGGCRHEDEAQGAAHDRRVRVAAQEEGLQRAEDADEAGEGDWPVPGVRWGRDRP